MKNIRARKAKKNKNKGIQALGKEIYNYRQLFQYKDMRKLK